MNSKKILILNSLYAPNIGGVENSIKELSKSFSKENYHVDIICSNRNFIDNNELPYSDEDEFSTIYRYNVVGVGYFNQIKNCLFLIKSLIKKNKYAIVISRGYITSFCLSLLRVEYYYLIPSVIFEQNKKNFFNYSIKNKVNFIFSSLIQIIAFNSSKCIVFSRGMIDQVKKFKFFGKLESCSFGVDSERFFQVTDDVKNNIRMRLGLELNSKYILCLGRFSELKNFEIAIEAMTGLSEDYKLLLVGSGPQEVKYRELININKLKNRVLILGPTDEPEIFYKASDIFLMTSRYESFGQVLLEATASRLKLVAFKPSVHILTNTDSIYEDHPRLVSFVENVDKESLAEAISGIDISATEEIEFDSFIKKYSWDNLAKYLYLTSMESQ
ncbi:glycosyltransferase family 4 protein [Vibrio parahaemolyticus]|nr:glycosyltransferase family 4 protein [Vibrio parahaemolyticus]